MKETVDVFSICYNEEFMLPHFIKHYKENFNANITIIDNLSTDNSKQIIKDAGCNYLTYDTKGQIRDDVYLKIKNNCWKKSTADWVIVCDIDEFLEIDFDISKYTIINTNGYDMIGDIDSRIGAYNAMESKHVMFRPFHIKEINYTFGCHSCRPDGIISGSREFANVCHRKYISEEYVFNRHVEFEKRLSELNIKYGWGVHYQNTTKESIGNTFKLLKNKSKLIPKKIPLD